jgi:predicted TIM-barrel fold metal-dependent hydrolase
MTPTPPEGLEAPLEPERVIVDPHHHLWDHSTLPGRDASPPFLLREMARLVAESGQNVVQTVFVECFSMYRADGPEEMRPVGEVEFANGAAAMSATGRYGACRIAAGIVGAADLRMGAEVARVLEAQVAAGNGRLRGIRTYTAYAECGLHSQPPDPAFKERMLQPSFQEGARMLARYGLSLDVYCVHPQLPEVAALADACPDVAIVLNHLGTPMTFGPYAGRPAEAFAEWRGHVEDLARRPNVVVKLGGLGHDSSGPLSYGGTAHSEALATCWSPYVEVCVEAYGAARCMFESNFPPDAHACGYGAIWNTFKRIAAAASETEKELLFSKVAQRVYRLA